VNLYNKTESKASVLFFFWLVTSKQGKKQTANIYQCTVGEGERTNQQTKQQIETKNFVTLYKEGSSK